MGKAKAWRRNSPGNHRGRILKMANQLETRQTGISTDLLQNMFYNAGIMVRPPEPEVTEAEVTEDTPA